MPLKRIFQVAELEEVHKKILEVMSDEQHLSVKEIKERLNQKFQNAIGLQALNRHLEYLERRNYMESDNHDLKTWIKIRDAPLALEVLDAKVYEGNVSSRLEALWQFYLEHLDEKRPLYDKYARAYKDALKAKRVAHEQELKARRVMKEIQETRRRDSENAENQ